MRPMPKLEVTELPVDELVPYANNAKEHPQKQIDEIAESISTFGNCDPIGVWHNEAGEPEIVEGHGRVLALKKLGITTAPVIYLDHLTDEQRRAYTHVHNQTTMSSGFDYETLVADMDNLNMDWEALGFSKFCYKDLSDDWFNRKNKSDEPEEDNPEYNEFVDKFKAKKTTDDCYTPDNIYNAVLEYVQANYNIGEVVRPFYPNGNYQKYKYPDDCCVVDNPPFSILAEILKFYVKNDIKFFLFAPTLTLFSAYSNSMCYMPCGAKITYENGANINTSFITNLDNYAVKSVPDLYSILKEENDKNLPSAQNKIPKYNYPAEVLTSTMVAAFSKHGVSFDIEHIECAFTRGLDKQKEQDKAIFGGGFLLAEEAKRKAEEAKRKAEEAIYTWKLSPRELSICESLGKGND